MRIWPIAALFLAVAAPALAFAMNAQDAKKTFMGLDMRGYLVSTKETWHECIRPSGETSYWFGGSYDEGRLRVRDDGLLCFSYKSTGYSEEACFTAQKAGANWRFVDETDSTTVFITTKTRAVKACPDNQAPIS